jgi:murein DD-endopeptidase MepM/ murein hydrolase activator NlpD
MLESEFMPRRQTAAEQPTEWLLEALTASHPEPSRTSHRRSVYRRQRGAGRRLRGRSGLVAVILFGAALVVTCILAVSAYAMPGPYARAGLVSVAGRVKGFAVVQGSADDNTTVVEQAGEDAGASWGSGRAVASSCVEGQSLVSSATVTFSDVSLLDGRVRADRLEVDATCAASRTLASGDSLGSYIENLTVDGKPVEVGDLPLQIKGVGRLSGLDRRVVHNVGGVEVQVCALRLELTETWRNLPEGSELVVGFAAAAADVESADRLVPMPTPKPTPRPSHTPQAQAGHSASKRSGGSASGASSLGSSPAATGFSPGPMPPPKSASTELVDFSGAVFPVKGKVWYSDDFGAPRAVGGGHTGNDIFARRGTPLVAVQDGTIEELRYRSLGGNSLHLVNDNGDYFYYAHLDHYAAGIDNGTRVTAGQVIGYVGNTGNARTTPPHCHFEIHPGGGGPVDPYPYLELWRGAKPAVSLVPAVGDTAAPAPSASSRPLPDGVSNVPVRHGSTSRDATVTRGRAAGLPAAGLPLSVAGFTVVALVRRRRLRLGLIGPDDVPSGLKM